jgi:hypothetical protein
MAKARPRVSTARVHRVLVPAATDKAHHPRRRVVATARGHHHRQVVAMHHHRPAVAMAKVNPHQRQVTMAKGPRRQRMANPHPPLRAPRPWARRPQSCHRSHAKEIGHVPCACFVSLPSPSSHHVTDHFHIPLSRCHLEKVLPFFLLSFFLRIFSHIRMPRCFHRCQNINWASRDKCNQCGASKPGTSQVVPAVFRPLSTSLAFMTFSCGSGSSISLFIRQAPRTGRAGGFNERDDAGERERRERRAAADGDEEVRYLFSSLS